MFSYRSLEDRAPAEHPLRRMRALVDSALEQLDYNLRYRWFVGLALDDAVCVPTTFTKNRDRLLEGDMSATCPREGVPPWEATAASTPGTSCRAAGARGDAARGAEHVESSQRDRRPYDAARGLRREPAQAPADRRSSAGGRPWASCARRGTEGDAGLDGSSSSPEGAENLGPAAALPLQSLFSRAGAASQRRFSAAC
jgi:hypothetical protein